MVTVGRERTGWLSRLLLEPVDIASLVVFRVAFGGVLLWDVVWYLARGWVTRDWIEPSFHFTYYGFGWVGPWPGSWLYVHVVILGVLALSIAIGWRYRVATALFFFGFTYLFLLEQARYLNHFYLVCLISFLMIFVPAHREGSLDARFRPSIRSSTVPAWGLWCLRAQIAVVYFFGGVAKLNADWLRAEPLREWLPARRGMPVLGPLFEFEWTAWFFAYSGLLIDLFIVPFLLWKRTRAVAFVVALGFHLLNSRLFTIGIFPWFMIAATTLFLSPDWPRRLLARFGSAGALAPAAPETPRSAPSWLIGRPATLAIVAWFTVQCLVPLRHFLYPGVVHWTEEGHRFAWHMKLRDKDAEAWFHLKDPATGSTKTIQPESLLATWQVRKMRTRPDMILQFCHHLAELEREQGREGVEVRASVMATLHGRPYQLMIDPTVDLAAQPRTLRHESWILPLKNELPTRGSGE